MSVPVVQQARLLLTTIFTGKIAFPSGLGSVWSRSFSYPRTVPVASKLQIQSAHVMKPEEETADMAGVNGLKKKMDILGIVCDDSCRPGLYNCLFCPKCKGGQSTERSLSVHISQDGDFAMWRCFRLDCGWTGKAFADSSKIGKPESPVEMTVESLGLESLGSKLIAYFGERGISEATLRRNAVMQKSGDQAVIGFTYRQKGNLVGCKYRTVRKRFWQEKGTERWLCGVDDIIEASEIIIVEGEIDKLSVEEAGFRNCVSVPGGAPQKVSTREIPIPEKDIAFQYLWNNNECLDKVSRIILATDCDTPGQALAEELARRLGKERCWRVRWPKKDEFTRFKDSNEVLMDLGSCTLREVINNAEIYREGS